MKNLLVNDSLTLTHTEFKYANDHGLMDYVTPIAMCAAFKMNDWAIRRDMEAIMTYDACVRAAIEAIMTRDMYEAYTA